MEHGTNGHVAAKPRQVVAGIQVVESVYKVERPVYEDVVVQVPKFVDKQVELPVGWDKLIQELTQDIANSLIDKCLAAIDKRLDAAINDRIKQIEVPKIIEREVVNVIKKDIEVTNAVIKDKPVTNAVIKDVEVKNAVVKDITVLNAVVEDVPIKNAVIEDVHVNRAIITEVPVVNAKIKDKVIEAISIKWVKPDGSPDNER